MSGQSKPLIAVALLIGAAAKIAEDTDSLDQFPQDVLQWMQAQISELVLVVDGMDMRALMDDELRRLIASVDPSWSSTHEPA